MSDLVADHVAEGLRLLQLGDEALLHAEHESVESYARAHFADAERYYRAATAHLQAALALDAQSRDVARVINIHADELPDVYKTAAARLRPTEPKP